ncbi:unnamed protein product [Vitrella brassicaformis CCMP3155]|uniref:Uncharacterized protein n=2 Tax=Vitrella brassicaformis TaxID=1169539 RepID=A0A0G4GM12_VITBC|nr:unnamed protein product [Vitrella brassicaformis CCMP3155]|eukprot:CEM31100.1 unnamed protein product [Vitrella brassicaformis CCMP3155]
MSAGATGKVTAVVQRKALEAIRGHLPVRSQPAHFLESQRHAAMAFIQRLGQFAVECCGCATPQKRIQLKKSLLHASLGLEVETFLTETGMDVRHLQTLAAMECPVVYPSKDMSVTLLETSPKKIINASKRLRFFLSLPEVTTCRSCSKRGRCARFLAAPEGRLDLSDVSRILVGLHTLCRTYVRSPETYNLVVTPSELQSAHATLDALFIYMKPLAQWAGIDKVPLADKRTACIAANTIQRKVNDKIRRKREAKMLNMPEWLRNTLDPATIKHMSRKQRAIVQRWFDAQDICPPGTPEEDQFIWVKEAEQDKGEWGQLNIDEADRADKRHHDHHTSAKRPDQASEERKAAEKEIEYVKLSDGRVIPLESLEDLPVKRRFVYRMPKVHREQIIQFNAIYNQYVRGLTREKGAAGKELYVDVDTYTPAQQVSSGRGHNELIKLGEGSTGDSTDDDVDIAAIESAEDQLDLLPLPRGGYTLVDLLNSDTFAKTPAKLAPYISVAPKGLEGVQYIKKLNPADLYRTQSYIQSLWGNADLLKTIDTLPFIQRVPFDQPHHSSGGVLPPNKLPFRHTKADRSHHVPMPPPDRRQLTEGDIPDELMNVGVSDELGDRLVNRRDGLLESLDESVTITPLRIRPGRGRSQAQPHTRDSGPVQGEGEGDMSAWRAALAERQREFEQRQATSTRQQDDDSDSDGQHDRPVPQQTASAQSDEALFHMAVEDRQTSGSLAGASKLAQRGNTRHPSPDADDPQQEAPQQDGPAASGIPSMLDVQARAAQLSAARSASAPGSEGEPCAGLVEGGRISVGRRRRLRTIGDKKEDSDDEDHRFMAWKAKRASPDSSDSATEDAASHDQDASITPPTFSGGRRKSRRPKRDIEIDQEHDADAAGDADSSPFFMESVGGSPRLQHRGLKLVDSVDFGGDSEAASVRLMDVDMSSDDVRPSEGLPRRAEGEENDPVFRSQFRVGLADVSAIPRSLSAGEVDEERQLMTGKLRAWTQSKGHIETPFTRFPKFTDYSKDAYSPTEQRRQAKDTHSPPPTSRMPRAKLEQATLGELSKYIKAPPSSDQDDAQDGDRHGSDVAPLSGPRVKGKGVEDDQAWESKYGVQKEWSVQEKHFKDKQGAGKHHALGGAVPVNPQTTEMARSAAALQRVVDRQRKAEMIEKLRAERQKSKDRHKDGGKAPQTPREQMAVSREEAARLRDEAPLGPARKKSPEETVADLFCKP